MQKCWIVKAIPVVPPVTRPDGKRNSLTVSAYKKLPKITQAKDGSSFSILFEFSMIILQKWFINKKTFVRRFSLTNVDRGFRLIRLKL